MRERRRWSTLPSGERSGIIEQREAQAFAATWIAHWNRHDLDAILGHYAEDVRFHSPFARTLTGDGLVVGRAALRGYWSEGLKRRPALHFALIDLFEGDGALALHLRDERGQRTVETMLFDAAGKVVLSTGCYLVANGADAGLPGSAQSTPPKRG